MTPEQARTWARAEAAKRNVRELAELVAPTRLMPLKGIELTVRYGVPAADRQMLDFDILVGPGAFDNVVRSMESSGYHMIKSNYSTKVMIANEGFVPVDVHRMPLPPLMGRWGARELFQRGEHRKDLYGAEVLHAAPGDFFVLLLANCLKDQLPDRRAESVARDLVAVAAATSPSAVLAAARDGGLVLACWIVLVWLDHAVDGFPLAAFRRALEPGRLDRLRASCSLALLPRWRDTQHELAYALARSNADGIWRGSASALLSFVRAGRDVARQVLGRVP